jgi:hypothetical protein
MEGWKWGSGLTTSGQLRPQLVGEGNEPVLGSASTRVNRCEVLVVNVDTIKL